MKIEVETWEPLHAKIQNYCCQGLREFWTLKMGLEKDGVRIYAPHKIELTSSAVTYGGDAQIRGNLTYRKLPSALMKFCPFCGEKIRVVTKRREE